MHTLEEAEEVFFTGGGIINNAVIFHLRGHRENC